MSVFQFVFVMLSILLSICLLFFLSVCLPISGKHKCLPFCLSVYCCLSISYTPLVFLSVLMSACLSFYLPVCLPFCINVYLSICFILSLDAFLYVCLILLFLYACLSGRLPICQCFLSFFTCIEYRIRWIFEKIAHVKSHRPTYTHDGVDLFMYNMNEYLEYRVQYKTI